MSDTKYAEQCLRAMAWERAKGELYSILVTYRNQPEEFGKLNKTIADFIEFVEDNAIGGMH